MRAADLDRMPVIAKSRATGLGYVEVDRSTQDTGYVYVRTVNGARYIVHLANVIDLEEQ